MQQNRVEYNGRSYLYSFFIHSALIVLMWNVTVFFEVDPPKFFEMDLGSVSSQRIEQILDVAAEARQREQEALTPGQRVEVPERRMIEIEEPTISVSSEQKITPQDIVTNAEKMSFEVAAPEIRPIATEGSMFSMDRKESFEGSMITIGEEPGAGIETSAIGSDLVFTLEGEIRGREIVSNPLPQYPPGLNQSAVIKISFEVLPDGSVSSSGMVPVRKENAVLEELTMNSLRLWRFSPLPDGDVRNQNGVLTFNYRVQ